MRFSLLFLWLSLALYARAQVLDFNRQFVSDGWTQACGFAFDEVGQTYVWLKEGKVYVIDTLGQKLPDPLIDINEEVVNWRDHGLLGFALHPNFLNNGYFYLYYAVDRHHLLYFGTPQYDPTQSEQERASIGRITRYTADWSTNYSSIVPGSRKVILGKTVQDGIPLLHQSHGVGNLLFGKDGTLLVSAGDGASYSGADYGGEANGAYANQAIQDGIIEARHDIGSFRAQSIHSLNGKILRIDPETGEGLPSNPFFDASSPNAAQSKVWALGFRNPFRFALQPGTGSHDPTEGDPGTLYVGDVGSAYWEEINVVDSAGQNFGWPIFEGMNRRFQYNDSLLTNPDAPNPLGCETFFDFHDLLIQQSLNSPQYLNPCAPTESIPVEIPR
ncbi:MAG: PQQ-dependent sugar dehydrogenase, partial [Bacteroidota bacterium]